MAASVVLCISNNDNVLDLENDDLFRGFITWNTFRAHSFECFSERYLSLALFGIHVFIYVVSSEHRLFYIQCINQCRSVLLFFRHSLSCNLM